VHVRIDRAESASAERAPVGGPGCGCRRATIAAQQLRSGESAPQRGSRLPIIPLIRRASDAYCDSKACPAFMLQSTDPRQQLPHRRAEYSHASKRRSGESAPQRGREHPSFRLVSYAHDRSETRLAFILHSTEPSRQRLDEPHRWTRSLIPSRQVLPPSSFAAVRARPKVGRPCRSFRSFRPASDAHYGVRGLARMHVRIDRAESAAQSQPLSVRPMTNAIASSISASGLAAVRARPNVGRGCRSFRSFRQASDAIGQRSGSCARSDRPSRVS
jgi:hypothetical protein